MKSEYWRVNIETGEYTEKVVLDTEDDANKSVDDKNDKDVDKKSEQQGQN